MSAHMVNSYCFPPIVPQSLRSVVKVKQLRYSLCTLKKLRPNALPAEPFGRPGHRLASSKISIIYSKVNRLK